MRSSVLYLEKPIAACGFSIALNGNGNREAPERSHTPAG